MNLVVFKVISALVLLVVALIGGFLPIKIKNLSIVVMHVANCFAGGILIAVALVHMLPDAAEELTDTGKSFSKALGGGADTAFPIANALFLIGFLFILSLEAIMHHRLGVHSSVHDSFQSGAEEGLVRENKTSNAGGWAALVGLSVHSVIEGVAAGASEDTQQAFGIILAIACHKGFASFALSSANISLLQGDGKKKLWILIVLWFSLSGSIGILIGMAASANLDGAGSATIVSLAAGTLLSVGITEMIVPAFNDKRALGWKLAMAAISSLAMTLLAVWA